jgi:hypothetical protein
MKEIIVNKVYSAAEINFSINDVAAREEPRKILMAHPEYFDIVDVKNVHMEGNIGSLDKLLAIKQCILHLCCPEKFLIPKEQKLF